MKKIHIAFALSFLLVACGDNSSASKAPAFIEGTFQIENGKDVLIFTKEGEVTSKHPLFDSKVANYKKNGAEITFQFNEGHQMKLTVVDENHLKSFVGGTFVKK